MPIEFRCSQCQKLLRTGDDTAGKRAKCPECGAIVDIPEATAPPPPPIPDRPSGFGAVPPPPPGGSGGSPFGAAGPSPIGPGDAENPYASPREFAPGAPYAAAPYDAAMPLGHAYLDLGDVFSRTWTIFQDNWGMSLVVLVVAFVLNIGASLLANFIPILGPLASWVFGIWISIGQALFFLKTARGQEASLEDLFAGGPYLLNVILANILLGLMLFGAAILCAGPLALVGVLTGDKVAMVILIVVGAVAAVVVCVVLGLMFSQFLYLIVDRNVGPIESLNLSKRVMVGNKTMLFLIGLVAFLLTVVAVIPCGLGLLVVGPFFALMAPVVYLTITAQPTAEQLRRPPPA
jgi:phage FluMu protein Com